MKKIKGELLNMSIDNVDLEIINILCKNSKLSFKEIGGEIHMTGQAVGIRINKLIDDGIIENFTINFNKEKLGINIIAMIKVYMKTNDHGKIKKLIDNTDEIVEAFRVSADACYFLKVETGSNEVLNNLLDKINEYANYQLSLSVAKLK
jgi:Lrp/AsnC family leucine-responsive transcriptional regulator